MIAAGILPFLISLAVDSPYDYAEMSRKACKTLANLTATTESALAVIKVLSIFELYTVFFIIITIISSVIILGTIVLFDYLIILY